MDFGDFNSGGSSNSRDRLEITDSGSSREEEKYKKERTRRVSGMYGGSSGGGRFSGGSGDGFGKLKIILYVAFLLLVLFLLNNKFQWVEFGDTPKKLSHEEGISNMMDAAKDLHVQQGEVSGVREKLPEVYKKNNVHDGSGVMKKPEDVYLVYVYTLDKKLDKEFNRFVKLYDKDVKIYKVDSKENTADFGITDEKYFENIDKPHFILVNRLESNTQIVDSYYFEDNLGAVIENVNKLKQRQKMLEDI